MITVKERLDTKTMIKISVLSVIAFLIMLLEIPMWFTPVFLKVDLSDIAPLIGAFALGPFAGVVIEFIKNILHITLRGTTTMGIGELANFFVGSVFVYTAGVIYHKNKSFKNAIIGMALGTIFMTVLATLVNYIFLIPFYAKLYGFPINAFIEMGSKVNKFVVDYKSFILCAILPFNLIKGIMISLVTLPLYKKISWLLHK
ncbi:MAG: ECF transporter S component [Firmicutes bacterium]|nr:ECF transporter S component [Bacillota bacterium]